MIFDTLSSNLLGLALAAVLIFAISFYVGLFFLSLIGEKLDEVPTALVGIVVILVVFMLWRLLR
jgi:hypothetical protein